MPATAPQQQLETATTLALPKSAVDLRIAIVSDAISGRNGVGTYYPDLIHHIKPHVDEVQLVAPQDKPERDLESFALPMPGDPTQRLAWHASAESAA